MIVTMSDALGRDQIEAFIERGWTMLRGAFPRSVADAVVTAIGAEAG